MGSQGAGAPPEATMSSIFGISGSGALAEATRLAVSANNVANAETDGFVPSRVTGEELPSGGVTTRVEREADPVAEARADRALGATAPSRTDLVQEQLVRLRASTVYRANLAALRTEAENQDALMKLIP